MKDLHNHILFGIDDGCYELEESIALIEKAKENGYSSLVLTPHYRQVQNFVADNKTKKKLFEELKKEVDIRDIDIELYLGNEVTLDEDLFYLLKTGQVTTINDGRYMLVELPLYEEFDKLDVYLDELLKIGVVPIIAHPERYEYYKNLNKFVEMIDKGILFQGNIGTLYGKYGKSAKLRLEEMLKKHMIHFMASDVHHVNQTGYARTGDVVSKLEELTGSKSMALELVDSNIDNVIHNEKINVYPLRIKKVKLKVGKR